jgi:hypothetical protein
MSPVISQQQKLITRINYTLPHKKFYAQTSIEKVKVENKCINNRKKATFRTLVTDSSFKMYYGRYCTMSVLQTNTCSLRTFILPYCVCSN